MVKTPWSLDLSLIHQEKMHSEANERVKEIWELHKKVQNQIEKANDHYQNQANRHRMQALFQPGDLVWVHLRKERFSFKRKSKLMPKANGSFEVLKKINDNAYKADLPKNYDVLYTFNVIDLRPYFVDDKLENWRTNSFPKWEDDVPMEDQQGELMESLSS